jgi:hypothetical protein
MWVAVTVPFMVVAVVIATAPLLWGMINLDRVERRAMVLRSPSAAPPEDRGVGATLLAETTRLPNERGIRCPVCAAAIGAPSNEALFELVQRHAWRQHGIPSLQQVLESAVAS